MSPMLSYFNGRFLATWKLSVSSEDEPGQRVMWAQSGDGATWETADGSSNELFPSMNSTENPRVALFAEPTLLLNGRVYAAASPRQFCLVRRAPPRRAPRGRLARRGEPSHTPFPPPLSHAPAVP